MQGESALLQSLCTKGRGETDALVKCSTSGATPQPNTQHSPWPEFLHICPQGFSNIALTHFPHTTGH